MKERPSRTPIKGDALCERTAVEVLQERTCPRFVVQTSNNLVTRRKRWREMVESRSNLRDFLEDLTVHNLVLTTTNFFTSLKDPAVRRYITHRIPSELPGWPTLQGRMLFHLRGVSRFRRGKDRGWGYCSRHMTGQDGQSADPRHAHHGKDCRL